MTDDDLERRARTRVGTVLDGKYTLEAMLGIGGMAAVYRARHRNGTPSAVKLLHPELAVVADLRERFLREGYVANQVEHAGAVRIIDDDVAPDGSVYLVMELLEGETLEARIASRGGTLPAAEIVPIMCDVLDVLAAAHARGIIHRDVKPENIFLSRNSEVKLLDFGIARVRDGAGTMTGAFLGTPQYMSPEQARGESRAAGPATDLWSVGAVVFRALAGRVPHDESNGHLTLIAAATREAPPLVRFAPNVGAELAAAIEKALAVEPAARFVDAGAMRRALASARMDNPMLAETDPVYPVLNSLASTKRNVAAEPSRPAPVTILSSTANTVPPPARRSAWPWIAMIGVVVATSAGVSFYLVNRGAPHVMQVWPDLTFRVNEPAPEPPRSSNLGRVALHGYPQAKIYEGSTRLCTTPCYLDMTPGRHDISFQWGNETVTKPIMVVAGKAMMAEQTRPTPKGTAD